MTEVFERFRDAFSTLIVPRGRISSFSALLVYHKRRFFFIFAPLTNKSWHTTKILTTTVTT